MKFIELSADNAQGIADMSAMAASIVREHFDPIIGKAQNDYMIALFQSEESIKKQISGGYRYYFVTENDKNIGYIAFYPKKDTMYLSKFYLYRSERGKGHAREMLDFIIGETKKAGLDSIELNVNRNNDARFVYERLGFTVARTEKNDIGNGFYMDDYVYRKNLF